MPESELSKRLAKAIRAADKLVTDIRKDTDKLRKAFRELRELKEGKDEEEKGV